MTYYAITKGEYSDYHICAITADKEKAERLKKIYTDEWDDAEIEEYEDAENGEVRVFFRYDLQNGEVSAWDFNGEEKVMATPDGAIFGVDVYAQDADHARKKAYDMIAKYMAENAGI